MEAISGLLNWSEFLGWFIPACVALGLYLWRRRDSRRRLKKALRSEIQGHERLDDFHRDLNRIVAEQDLTESGGEVKEGVVAPPGFLSTVVYESHVDQLGTLDDDIVEKLITYYTQLRFVKDLVQTIHEGSWLPPSAYNSALGLAYECIEEREDLIEALETTG